MKTASSVSVMVFSFGTLGAGVSSRRMAGTPLVTGLIAVPLPKQADRGMQSRAGTSARSNGLGLDFFDG